MAKSWYYVKNNERVGPVNEQELKTIFDSGELGKKSFVWTKGFDNWRRAEEVDELESFFIPAPSKENFDFESVSDVDRHVSEKNSPSSQTEKNFDWNHLKDDQKVVTIKIGYDRGLSEEVEYGPYNIIQLKRAFKENRINGKTFVFVSGLENWQFLAETPLFHKITDELPPVIEESEKRMHVRKPFLARLFFHDQNQVYDGVCRDISIGGLQVLVSGFPGEVGNEVSMNVHPDNSNYSFTAAGKIVRLLEGGSGFSLRFTELDEDSQKAINSYVQYN